MKRYLLISTAASLLLISFFAASSARADVAPPESPPGSDIVPGAEVTQVRMMSETVILNIAQNPSESDGAIANTAATFTMRNLGSTEETMQARFPLSFFAGSSDGFGNYPEIAQIAVKVDGKPVNTQRVLQPVLFTEGPYYYEREEIPWAVFNVTFPPARDVTIEVAYTVNGFGYYPYEAFRYVLETGAGWKDTIGSADIIVRLPYEATEYNVWLSDGTTGYSTTTAGAVLNGRDVRWHFESLEPTWQNNIEVSLVTPSLWKKVLTETDTVAKNPNDGEAWGRLAKAYKEIVRMSKGYLREDSAGHEIYDLSKQAYETCLSLLPDDSLWHYGYADLLWSHYYFDIHASRLPDPEGILPRTLVELKTALELDPNNRLAKDLLSWISSDIPGSVRINGSSYDYLALTATPVPPTPFIFATETLSSMPTEISPSPTIPPVATATSPVATEEPSPSPVPSCGGAALILPALFGVLVLSRRRIR